MTFSDKKRDNKPFNVPMHDRIRRSLILKLVWKSHQVLKFSNSLTFPEFWIKCWNSLTFPWFFGQISNSLTFLIPQGFPRLRSNPATVEKRFHSMVSAQFLTDIFCSVSFYYSVCYYIFMYTLIIILTISTEDLYKG